MQSCRPTDPAFEVVLGGDLLYPLGRRPDQGRRVQVVALVEGEQAGQVRELLVADPVLHLPHGLRVSRQISRRPAAERSTLP